MKTENSKPKNAMNWADYCDSLSQENPAQRAREFAQELLLAGDRNQHNAEIAAEGARLGEEIKT
jgi:hypothetical protein